MKSFWGFDHYLTVTQRQYGFFLKSEIRLLLLTEASAPWKELPMLRYPPQPFYAGILHCGIRLQVSNHHFTSPMISPSKPSVSFSVARMSARISSSVRIGCGL